MSASHEHSKVSSNVSSEAKSLKTPILVMGVILVLLALAWFPSHETPIQQRPYVDLHVQYDANNARLEQLATDLRYRMGTHHEYRMLGEQTLIEEGYVVHRIRVELTEREGQLHLVAQINDQNVEVNGPRSAASSLSAKLFSLINATLVQA